MLKLHQKSKYSTEMLYYLAEHTLINLCTIHNRSQEKNFTPVREIVQEGF